MQVLKFGGTSMGDEHTWRNVLQIISGYKRPVVIVSATARTTRQLIAAAEEAVDDYDRAASIAQDIENRHRRLIKNFMANYPAGDTKSATATCEEWISSCIQNLLTHLQTISKEQELSPKLKDAVASVGEQLSSRLLVACGSVFGLPMIWVDAHNIIKTDSEFGSANPDYDRMQQSTKDVSSLIEDDHIPVMGGYYGQDADGATTTLGFEGSDYSASLLGSFLNAQSIEIWTDVSGIYTCDPRVVEEAFPIDKLSFREATEMAYFGAKVLHPATMLPAEQKGIPIVVKNIFEPEHPGTLIDKEAPSNGIAKAMTFLNEVAIITVTSPHTRKGFEFLADVFGALKEHHIPVNVVTTTEASVSVALKNEYVATSLLQKLEASGTVSQATEMGIISLIGCAFNDERLPGKKVLNILDDRQVRMISYSQPKRNLNIVIPEKDLLASVKKIHQEIFEPEN